MNVARLPNVDDDNGEPEEKPPPPSTLDFELDPPVTFQKKNFTTLHLCEPTAIMMEKAESELGNVPNAYTLRRYQVVLVAQVARVPIDVVQRMRTTEVERAFDFLSDLLAYGRKTGES